MAERRMFSKSVVESDPFMDMPAEAQALYFHLNMAADDDGFCDNPRSIMRACGASNDTMKLLIAKKFVLTFEKNDGFVVVVKHWRLNNYIRKDTYHETKYKEFMRELYFDENQSYSMNPGDGHVPCLPQSSPASVTAPSQPCNEPVTDASRPRDDPLTQDRLGKDSTVKSIVRAVKDSKGESEGEPAPGATPSQPVGNSPAGEQPPDGRTDRLDFFIKQIRSFNAHGYNTTNLYDWAATEGFSAAEIDGRMKEAEQS